MLCGTLPARALPPMQQSVAAPEGAPQIAAASEESELRQALVARPEEASLWMDLGRVVAAQGRSAEAVEILMGAASRALRIAAWEDAVELLRLADEIAPDTPEILRLLGRAQLLSREYLSAEVVLTRLVERGATDEDLLLLLGSAQWENGRYEAAEANLRSAGSPAATCALGRLLRWRGRHPEAVSLLARCAAWQPAAGEIQLELARALEGASRHREATVAYRRACELLPDHYEARYGLAMALAREGDREAAEREMGRFRRLLAEDQGRTTQSGLEAAQIDHARNLLRLGRGGEAVTHLQALPPTADSLAALSAAYLTLGEREAAREALTRAVALAPQRQDLQVRLNELRLEELRQP